MLPNETKTGLILTLLPPRAFRSVRAHLQWPDKTVPMRGAIDALGEPGDLGIGVRPEEWRF